MAAGALNQEWHLLRLPVVATKLPGIAMRTLVNTGKLNSAQGSFERLRQPEMCFSRKPMGQ